MAFNKIKCVVVGDAGVGKTSLLTSYISHEFPKEHIPTVFETYEKPFQIGLDEYTLILVDTAGQEAFSRLRPLSYSQTDVFLVCFSVVNPESYENTSKKWKNELKHFCPNVPILLIGTKIDLRENSNEIKKLSYKRLKPINTEQGEKLAKELKAVKYIECSALIYQKVNTVFDEAISAALTPQSNDKCRCFFL